jgi:hypothetical protein
MVVEATGPGAEESARTSSVQVLCFLFLQARQSGVMKGLPPTLPDLSPWVLFGKMPGPSQLVCRGVGGFLVVFG